MRRLFLTLAIGIGLFAALQMYARWVTPLTRAVEQPRLPPKPSASASPSSSASSQTAKSWLAEEEWIQTAAIRWQRSDQTFMYAHSVETVTGAGRDLDGDESGDLIRMRPFAMIWKDSRHPEQAPLTIVAESARIRFENHFFDANTSEEQSFNLSGEDPGRMVAAALEGKIRITGPDGLVVDGQDFIFTDEAESAVLYSDFPVKFRYGPTEEGESVNVRGASASGLLIHFDHDPNSPLGNDMPKIAERPRSAELRGRVVIDFLTESKDGPARTRVSSEGPFKYDFPTSTATFRDKVLVHRPQGDSHRDEIECNLLALIFEPREENPDSESSLIVPVRGDSGSSLETPPFLSQLVLRHIRAMARQNPRTVTPERVTLRSTANGIECELDDLQYDARQQLFTLTDPERVNVWREVDGQLQKFDAPKIEIRHDEANELIQLSGIGIGEFSHRSNAQTQKSADLWAKWKDRLDLVPDPEHLRTILTLRGSATIGQWDQMQFSGQTITAQLLDLKEIQSQDPHSSPAKLPHLADPTVSPIQKIHAVGNVTLVAPGVVGRRIDQIEIFVEPGQIVPWTKPESQSPPQARKSKSSKETDLEEIPFVFECTRITGHAVFDSATQSVSIRDLQGFEGVQLFRAGPEQGDIDLPFEQQPIRVSAEEFNATNEGGNRQILTLLGKIDEDGRVKTPVVARFGDLSIKGPRLIVDREKNLATVDVDRSRSPASQQGQVVLRFPVNRDFTGQPLHPPTIADIACLEKITFDGERATFLDSVKASLLDSNIRAERMTATLNRRIDFSGDRPDTEELAISSMECQDKVSVEMYQYDPSKELIEILRAKLHQFEINQQTGVFQGQGRGLIEDWRRTGTRRILVQSRGQAQSNRPADSHRNYPWEYVSIRFNGRLEGNVQDRWGKLTEDVELMYAPVKNAYLVFERDELSGDEENSKNAVWVGSDQMTVGLSGDQSLEQTTTATIEALGNAQMEGHSFNAFAYSLQYEQAKEMYTLLGRGREKATLNVQSSINDKPSKLTAQVMRIFPSKQEVSVDNAKSFTTTFGGD